LETRVKGCLSKKRFREEDSAKKFCEEKGYQQRVYLCEECLGYHLTSHVEKRTPRIRHLPLDKRTEWKEFWSRLETASVNEDQRKALSDNMENIKASWLENYNPKIYRTV